MADRRPRYTAEFEMLAQKFVHLNGRYDQEGDVLRQINDAMENNDEAELVRIQCRLYRPGGICDVMANINVAEQGLRLIYDPKPEEVDEARAKIAVVYDNWFASYYAQRAAERSAAAHCRQCNPPSPPEVVEATTSEAQPEPIDESKQSEESEIIEQTAPVEPVVRSSGTASQRARAPPLRLKCINCNGEHGLCRCEDFKYRMTAGQRRSFALERIAGRGGCINCFKTTHLAEQCTDGECRKCRGQRHNSLLCKRRYHDAHMIPRPTTTRNAGGNDSMNPLPL